MFKYRNSFWVLVILLNLIIHKKITTMKKIQFIKTGFLVGILFMSFSVQAQRGQGNRNNRPCQNMQQPCFNNYMACENIADLSDEQTEKIKGLRQSHWDDIKPIAQELRDKRVAYLDLLQVDSPDWKAINKNIDASTSLMNKLMRKKAKHHQKIRSLLDDEQKEEFDAHLDKMSTCGRRANMMNR